MTFAKTLASAIVIGFVATSASAEVCKTATGWQQCDPVPNNQFSNGTRNDPPDCENMEFQLRPELLTRDGIVLNNGTYEWTFRLITLDSANRPIWQIAEKVANRPSKTQSVYLGTVAATYITCDEHTGWYAAVVNSCNPRAVTLERVNWTFDWQQLEAMTR